jgi:hypothetical protein
MPQQTKYGSITAGESNGTAVSIVMDVNIRRQKKRIVVLT